MKNFNTSKIIGIDHGYGNMKTANHCFPTGIIAYDSEPLFTADMLSFNGKYYLIGEGHKEFVSDKIKDEDYYILTLAAIAKELKAEDITEADVHIAAGLPLTWTSGQKNTFAAYLTKNAQVSFTYRKEDYHTVQANVLSVQWTAFYLMSLWLSSYHTLPMRTVNTLKNCSIRKRPIFSAHRRMKKSCPTSERRRHSLKRQ